MKIDTSNICKTKFSASNEMPIELKNYYKKQPFLFFALYNFLIFLDTQLHFENVGKRPFLKFLVMAFQFFQEKFMLFRGVRYTKDRGWVLQT